MANKEEIKTTIHQLYNLMNQWPDQSAEVLNITDVLLQVYTKLDQEKQPEVLINKLVHYIRSMALKGRLHFPKKEEELMIALGLVSQKAGLNGLYRADYSDKSQFYSYAELSKMQIR